MPKTNTAQIGSTGREIADMDLKILDQLEAGLRTASRLAQLCGIPVQSISASLSRLGQQGWVRFDESSCQWAMVRPASARRSDPALLVNILR